MNRALAGAAGVIASLGVVAGGELCRASFSRRRLDTLTVGRASRARAQRRIRPAGPDQRPVAHRQRGQRRLDGDLRDHHESTQTSTGTLADITAGSCITATGTKGAGGTVTAATVILSAPVNGSCAGAGFGGGGTFSPRPGASFSPRPSFSPPPQAAGFTAVRGQVKSVTGTSVTLTEFDRHHHDDRRAHDRQGHHLVRGDLDGSPDR